MLHNQNALCFVHTPYQQVKLLDKCLSKFETDRKQLMKLGCVCLRLAEKGDKGPVNHRIEDFVDVSEGAFTTEEVKFSTVLSPCSFLFVFRG